MPSPGSFIQRLLRATLTLGTQGAVFPGTNNNQLVLSDLTIKAYIDGTVSMPSTADIKIFGMKQQDMNALTIAYGLQGSVVHNTILLEAQNASGGWSQIYFGDMVEACPQYDAMPSVYFQIIAQNQYVLQLAGAPATMYNEPTPVSKIAGDIAQKMGLSFNNQGVTAILPPQYLAGTLMEQLRIACAAANANGVDTDWFINAQQLTITPRNKARSDLPTLQVTPDNGLIGYPIWTRSGLIARVLFDPTITMQQAITISGSDVPSANGTWGIVHFDHELESIIPDGAWRTTLQLTQQALQGSF